MPNSPFMARTVIAMGFACAAAFATNTAQAQAADPKVLNIYNWSDYIAEDTIKNFEKATGDRKSTRLNSSHQ